LKPRPAPRITRLALVGSVPRCRWRRPARGHLAARDKAHGMINQWSYAPQSQLGSSSIPGINLTALNERLMQRQATACSP
jgi:hypothetical protein